MIAYYDQTGTGPLPSRYAYDPSDFDRGYVITSPNFNGYPYLTVLWNGAPVFVLDVEGWETFRHDSRAVECPYQLLTPCEGEEDTGYRAQSLASFCQHIGVVCDPHGEDEFGNAVVELGWHRALEAKDYLLDDGHEVLAFCEALYDKYRRRS